MIIIHWNPDNTGDVEFWIQQEITENGGTPRYEKDPRPEMNPLRIRIEDMLPRTFHVPVAFDAEGNPIAYQDMPCMLMMATIKQALDDFYSEKVVDNEMRAAQPNPEM